MIRLVFEKLCFVKYRNPKPEGVSWYEHSKVTPLYNFYPLLPSSYLNNKTGELVIDHYYEVYKDVFILKAKQFSDKYDQLITNLDNI